MGYASTIFEEREDLGGMMRYGIPNYRTPRDILDAEINRILDLGDIEVVLNKESAKIFQWMKLNNLMMQFYGLLVVGMAKLSQLEGSDAENCLSGVAF